MDKRTLGKLAAGSAFAVGIGAAAYHLFGRPRHLRWGATDEELIESLPGDDLKPDAENQVTHAITINAPAGVVWKWLIQIGQGRGGFYSYAFLENMIGLHVRNAEQIDPILQNLSVGDFIRSAPTNWLGGKYKDLTGWFVVEIDPERALVLRDEVEYGTWSFILKPVDEHTTRLIVRARGGKPETLAMRAFHYAIFEPAHFIMERKMLVTLKRLAEASYSENGSVMEDQDGTTKEGVGIAARA
jgi:hypothetical protein